MSRDFILVFSGGAVSLMTTLVVLFGMDYVYRRDQARASHLPPPEKMVEESTESHKDVD